MAKNILITKEESQQIAQQIIEKIRYILDNFGPREPGSESEYETQKYLAEELDENATSVSIEPFPVAPMGLLFFLPLTGIIVFFSSFAINLHPYLGITGIFTSLLIVWFQFGQYRRLLDPFLPKKESNNVFARWIPSGKSIKQRIVLCGHADSAYEMRFNQWGKIYIKLAVVIILICTIYLFVIAFLLSYEHFRGQELTFIPEIIRKLSIVPGALYGIIAVSFIRFSYVVPGANDNLSGSCLAVEVLKWFSKHPFEIQNTEIDCLITGSEEAGLRGAMAFVEKHKEELQSIPTVVIAIDTISDLKDMGVAVRDLNGLLLHHSGAISLLYQAGSECGVELKNMSVYLGSSDATVFTRNRIPATAFVAMDPSPARYYHTRYDTVEAMNKDALSIGLTIIIQAVKNYDTYGLPENGLLPVFQKEQSLEKSAEKLAVG